MRKEIILAVIIGIIFGLGVTFGLYFVRQRVLPNETAQKIEESRQQPATPTPTPQAKTLIVQQPDMNLLTKEGMVQVVGKAWPNSYIVILAADQEYVTTADDDGDFSQEIELSLGGNRLTVIATSVQGEQEQVVLSVVYSTVDLNPDESTASAE